MQEKKLTRSFVITKSQAEWLKETAERNCCPESYLVRVAIQKLIDLVDGDRK